MWGGFSQKSDAQWGGGDNHGKNIVMLCCVLRIQGVPPNIHSSWGPLKKSGHSTKYVVSKSMIKWDKKAFSFDPLIFFSFLLQQTTTWVTFWIGVFIVKSWCLLLIALFESLSLGGVRAYSPTTDRRGALSAFARAYRCCVLIVNEYIWSEDRSCVDPCKIYHILLEQASRASSY